MEKESKRDTSSRSSAMEGEKMNRERRFGVLRTQNDGVPNALVYMEMKGKHSFS